MNRAEKELSKKVLTFYNSSPKIDGDFTREENNILERWRVHKIMNEDAFVDVTSAGSDFKSYLQTQNYPFTSHGDAEINKDGYLRFRNSKSVIVIRDIFTVFAFLVSLYLAISKILELLPP